MAMWFVGATPVWDFSRIRFRPQCNLQICRQAPPPNVHRYTFASYRHRPTLLCGYWYKIMKPLYLSSKPLLAAVVRRSGPHPVPGKLTRTCVWWRHGVWRQHVVVSTLSRTDKCILSVFEYKRVDIVTCKMPFVFCILYEKELFYCCPEDVVANAGL